MRERAKPAANIETARALLSPSRRSDVPPFMVMDVMAAAARIEDAGGRVVHMEVGQPAAPAPATAIAAARRALDHGRIGYTEALGIPSLTEPHRAPLPRAIWARTRSRPRRGDDRLVGWVHSGLPRAVRARRPGGGRFSRLSALSQYSDGARLRAGDDRDFRRDALGDHRRGAAGDAPQDAAQGRDRREPRQSHRYDDRRRSSRGADPRLRRRRHPLHLRRDLSRPRLHVSGARPR